jgi:hypothetical protein
MTRSRTIDRGIEIETQNVETIEDFAEMVLNNYNVDDTEDKCNIYFTFDEDLESEPTGWFGIKIIKIFDGEALAIGYMGGGGIKTYSLSDDTFTKGYITSCIRSYLWQECRSDQDKVVVSVVRKVFTS